MGLDMYLNKHTRVMNYPHTKTELLYVVSVKRNGQLVEHIKPERVATIIEEICYWRKANAIHYWFVKNCQEGVDDCRQAYVETDLLQELCDTIKQILAVPSGEERDKLAVELLPPCQGFFFGSSAIDEYYYQDLEHTLSQLTDVLEENNKGSDYYYHSSW